MKPKSAKNSNLLDLMSEEDKAKVARNERLRDEMITAEWMGLAELGFFYGWEAVRDVIEDKITLKQAHVLIQGARKLHSSHVYDSAVAVMAGSATKKGSFDKIMKYYIKDMKAVQ